MLRTLPHLRRLAPLALLCALAACGDAPTLPRSFVQQAGGRTWVAVSEPAGLPEARTWQALLAPEAAARVRAAQDEASRARQEGRLEDALAFEGQARLSAAASLAKAPAPAALRPAFSALREWETRAAERNAAGRYPGLDSAATAVAALRARADEALARGDTRAAALRLAEAGEAARAYSPVAVGLRLVASAEQRIDADPSPSAGLRRARLLLHLAREALATGDETRAMKRAWYAVQLLDAERDSAR